MTSRSDTERLREVFADTARDITPSPVPLASIARTARTRRRRRAAATAVGAAALLVPLTATAVHLTTASDRVAVPPAAIVTPSPTAAPPSTPPPPVASPLHVVKPGQRVRPAPGTELWLTEEGKHWSVPGDPDQFRSVTDGNLDMSVPGVSAQIESTDGRFFMSGVYYGSRDAARVEIVTAAGPVTATLVTLTDRPGWGAWYATAESVPENGEDFVRSVTLYDSAGKPLSELPMSGGGGAPDGAAIGGASR
ncbi:hypothetical protein ABZ208_00650 [Streptomyces sp. NPDC006208]|uniref:hypothetical protein n=1 Tax=Streptomyces sp. NPDC006208 TaxID=3156734 RepID=UPI0033A87A46